MTLGDWLPNAGLLATALVFAWHAPLDQRRQAVLCWGIIALDWLNYVLSWTPFALHFALKAIGINILSEEIWPIVDAVAAIAVVAVAYDKLWAWMLWVCLVIQVTKSAAHQVFGGAFDPYTRFLDLFFWAQIACFLMIGGRGVRNRIADLAARVELSSRPVPARSSREARR